MTVNSIEVHVDISVEPTEEFDRLARLMGYVPERTCRYVLDKEQKAWKCSECGGLEPVCDGPSYCIDCGAKVVE